MTFSVCVPTLNAARHWTEFTEALNSQSAKPQRVIVIDSESADGTPELARQAGFELITIKRKEFRHGTTRQLAVGLAQDSDVLVYLTQDAQLAGPHAFAALLCSFQDESVGAAYGRQLPRREAGPIEAHARLFNYPPNSAVRSLESVRDIGFRAIFLSNSFSAYRLSALLTVGGFPDDVNFGEDTIVAARLLLSGHKIAYRGDSEVYHSHSYTVREEFQRYVSVGELHSQNEWLLRNFGGVSGEGLRFIRSEITLLAKRSPWQIPSALLRSGAKFLGYKIGRARMK